VPFEPHERIGQHYLGEMPVDEPQLDDLLNFVESANGGPIVDDIAVLVLASPAG